MTTVSSAADRRLDLDWLRIAALAVLILYHVGMFYVTWDWHVKSSRAGAEAEPLMLLVNPWRLTLLFIISGAATRFMADRMQNGPFLASRMGRLWPPLLLATFVIVPPQSYFELVEQIGYGESFFDFYPRYATGSGGWCDADGCLITPTYNHMWFVVYLIVYTLSLPLLRPLLRRVPTSLAVLIEGPGLILTPWLFMAALRLTLAPIFGQTHVVWDDWYNHALYLSAFLFGFAVARHEAFFAACQRWRFGALATALIAYALVLWSRGAIADPSWPEWVRPARQAVRELQAWAAIVAAFGFAYRHLRGADTPLRRYLTEAIFPAYLIHQTVIVVAGHYLDEMSLPLPVEAALLIGLTAAGCCVMFEIAKRSGPLRRWLGLKPNAAKGPDGP